MITRKLLVTLVIASLGAAACGGQGTGTEDRGSGVGSSEGVGLSAGGCLPESDSLVAAAREEGAVVMSGPPDEAVRRMLPPAFDEAYGIRLDYVGGRTSEIAAKLEAERAAGIYSQDVFIGGGDTMANVYYEWLTPLEELVPEEALGGSEWVRGEVPWVDPENKILKLSEYVAMPYVINTDEVDSAEVRTWKDLVDPKWRGRIVMADPTLSGGGANDVGTFMAADGYGEDFIRKLYVEQEPAFLADDRQMVDGLAKGKYAIGTSINQADVDRAIADGLPLKVILPEGDGVNQVTSGYGLLAVPREAPHPNAAKLLASWLACTDGNAVWNEAYGTYSTRADVPPPPGVADYQKVNPGVEYFDSYAWEFLIEGKAAAKAKIKELIG
jgi:iron(III) transport system substrate-binding protein